MPVPQIAPQNLRRFATQLRWDKIEGVSTFMVEFADGAGNVNSQPYGGNSSVGYARVELNYVATAPTGSFRVASLDSDYVTTGPWSEWFVWDGNSGSSHLNAVTNPSALAVSATKVRVAFDSLKDANYYDVLVYPLNGESVVQQGYADPYGPASQMEVDLTGGRTAFSVRFKIRARSYWLATATDTGFFSVPQPQVSPAPEPAGLIATPTPKYLFESPALPASPTQPSGYETLLQYEIDGVIQSSAEKVLSVGPHALRYRWLRRHAVLTDVADYSEWSAMRNFVVPDANLSKEAIAAEIEARLMEDNDGAAFKQSLVSALSPKLDDLKARILALGTAAVTIQAPVLEDGTILITRGDDYSAADDRAFRFDFEGGYASTLAARLQSVRLIVRNAATLSVAAAVTSLDAGFRCTFELSAAQTQALRWTTAKYFIRAFPTAGHAFDIAEGTAIIRAGSE